MRYRKLDSNGDYTIGSGADFFIDDAEGIAQAILTRLRLYLGEWFLDTTAGTPWKTDILGKYTKDAYDAAIKNVVLGTTGVNGILEYSSSFDGNQRELTIEATVDTIYGQVKVAGPI